MLTEFQKNTAMPSEPSHFEFEFENHIPDEVEIVDLNFQTIDNIAVRVSFLKNQKEIKNKSEKLVEIEL